MADPGKQFGLVASHIKSIKRLPGFEASRFIIYVERNLGFEAGEHLFHYVKSSCTCLSSNVIFLSLTEAMVAFTTAWRCCV